MSEHSRGFQEDVALSLSSRTGSGGDQSGWLDGSTLVNGRDIEGLYLRQLDGHLTKSTLSCYLDEGAVHRSVVNAIVRRAETPAYRIRTVSGRFVVAAAETQFMTWDGWCALSDMSPGMTVLVDQKVKSRIYRQCVDCGTQTNPDPANASERCYRCSAQYHSNPSKPGNGERIRQGIIQGYGNGRKSWGFGLTAENTPSLAERGRKISIKMKGVTYEQKYGTERADKMKAAASKRMSGTGNHMFGKPTGHAKGGYREDIGHYVRSRWEADYARVLVFLGEPYAYEPRTFLLTRADGAVLTYTPDFYLPRLAKYVEIKGFMRHLDAEKIRLFGEQYPEETLEVVLKAEFAALELMYKTLVAWECPKKPDRMEWDDVLDVSAVGNREAYAFMLQGPAYNHLANGYLIRSSARTERT